MKHAADNCKCVEPGATVRMGRDLFNRARCRPDYSPDEYARALAAYEGRHVPIVHRFSGPGGVYAYAVLLGEKCYHLPARYTAWPDNEDTAANVKSQVEATVVVVESESYQK